MGGRREGGVKGRRELPVSSWGNRANLANEAVCSPELGAGPGGVAGPGGTTGRTRGAGRPGLCTGAASRGRVPGPCSRGAHPLAHGWPRWVGLEVGGGLRPGHPAKVRDPPAAGSADRGGTGLSEPRDSGVVTGDTVWGVERRPHARAESPYGHDQRPTRPWCPRGCGHLLARTRPGDAPSAPFPPTHSPGFRP